jgi:serine/threonine-protein kinase
MSPEQALGNGLVDPRSDIYSLAALLFECLSGRPPHTATEREALTQQVLHEPAPPLRSLCPKLPAGLCAAIDQGLSRDRDQRHACSLDFAAALVPLAGARSIVVPDLGDPDVTLSEEPVALAAGRSLWPEPRGMLVVGVLLAALTAFGLGWSLHPGATGARAPNTPAANSASEAHVVDAQPRAGGELTSPTLDAAEASEARGEPNRVLAPPRSEPAPPAELVQSRESPALSTPKTQRATDALDLPRAEFDDANPYAGKKR